MANKKRILTGDRPTGPLHLGHFVGSLQNRIALQDKYDQFIMIADMQALTDNFKTPEKVSANVLEVALDYLAVGLDPKKSTIFIQSQIPEISQLALYLLNLTTLAQLQQNPTIKDEIRQRGFNQELPMGFLAYPVSQAADITAFNANLVPVGEDQLPMIELTRDIVRKFNQFYGNTLVLPEVKLSATPRLPGIDGKEKMSKSLGNTINLSDDAETVRKKVMKMYTDPTRTSVADPGHLEGNVVFMYLDIFDTNKKELALVKKQYQLGGIGDVAMKERLTSILNELLNPMRERRAKYVKDKKKVMKILETGTKKARKVAQETLARAQKAIGNKYF